MQKNEWWETWERHWRYCLPLIFETIQNSLQHSSVSTHKKNSSKISLISPFSLVFLGKSIASSTEFDLKSSHVFVTTGNWSPVAIRDKLKDNFQVSFL